MREQADELQALLEQANSWPIWSIDRTGGIIAGSFPQAGKYGESLRDIATWVALRESDKPELKSLIRWPADREYRIDPLPERIGEAFSDLLYSEEPKFIPPNTDDNDTLEEMVKENELGEQLKTWSDQSITEGELWWRVYVDKGQSEWPIVEAHSRLDVIPLWYGRRLVGAAFISEIATQKIQLENQIELVTWRLIEIQTEGYVRNLLYRGTVGGLGRREELGADPFKETEGLREEWEHGLKVMLAGRWPNRLGRDWRLGISQLRGVKDLIFDLNESRTIMAENARNTAKAKMIVSADELDEAGRFDAGKDVIVAESVNEALDNKKDTHVVLEYTFQARELMVHVDELVQTILARCGLAEQFVQSNKGGEGAAYTGTALRTRLIPTSLSAAGKGKHADKAVSQMLKAMAMAANLPSEQGGCGKKFAEADGKFIQIRGDVLPEDPNESTQRHVMGVQGEVESRYTAIQDLHPDWDDKQIQDEEKRIDKDHEPVAPIMPRPPNAGFDENQPPGGDKGVADAPPKPGTKTSDLRDAVGSRQATRKGTKGESPGKTPAANTSGGPR